VNNLVATVRPDYPGLNANKPVLATQPTPTLPESPKVVPKPTANNQVERDFSPASSVSVENQSRLQPATKVVRRFSAASGKRISKAEPSFNPAAHMNLANAQLALADTK